MQNPLLTEIESRFGRGAVQRLSDLASVGVVSTTLPQLDTALCIGGLPQKHMSVIVSTGTSGAATLAYRIAAQQQNVGELTALLDTKHTFDPDYAARCGLQLQQMMVVRGKHDRALETVHRVLSHVSLLIISELLPLSGRLRHDITRSNAAVVMLSSGEVPADAAVVIELQHRAWIRHRRDIVGYQSRAVVRKNRFAPAGQTADFEIRFDGFVDGDAL
ncbi:MAG: hypothetical protein AAFU54_04395 [Chloroflexota bacterium]